MRLFQWVVLGALLVLAGQFVLLSRLAPSPCDPLSRGLAQAKPGSGSGLGRELAIRLEPAPLPERPAPEAGDIPGILAWSVDALPHETFARVQRAVLLNVSRGVKLSAVVGARYMDELIIWTEQETERASIRDQALHFYRTAATNDPKNALVAYRRGVLLWHSRDAAGAQQELGAALVLVDVPRDDAEERLKARILFFLGKTFAEANDAAWKARGVEAYRRAVVLDPKLAQAHHDLALLLYEERECEETIKHLSLAMWYDPYRESSTPLLLVNDYQGHDYVAFTNAVVFELAKAYNTAYKAKHSNAAKRLSKNSSEHIDEENGVHPMVGGDNNGGMNTSNHPPQHLIFCINSGRSGSHFLATLFRTLDGPHFGFHEPMPQTHWHEETLTKPMEASYNGRRSKANTIRTFLDTAPPGATYSETSLNFITQFFDVIMREFTAPRFKVSVILLRRDLAKVLKSMMEVGWFDPTMLAAGEQWDRWTHSLHSSNAVLKPVAPKEKLTRYERAIGYLIDIEARARRFQEEYPAAHVLEVDLEGLNDRATLDAMLSALELVPGPLTHSHLGHRTNNKDTSKAASQALLANSSRSGGEVGITYERCVKEIQAYLAKCAALGIVVPPLPQFRQGQDSKGSDRGGEIGVGRPRRQKPDTGEGVQLKGDHIHDG